MRATAPRHSKGSGARHRNRWGSAGTRYEVLQRAGEGTLFVVYRVRDRNSGNRVMALKALKGAFNKDQRFTQTLSATAERSMRLTHPHLAWVSQVGEEEGTLFLVTEWLPGQSLEARLRRAPFGRAEALSCTRQIAGALNYLHHNGVVHGDLRPCQILASANGNLKLTEVGLSEAFAAAGMAVADVQQDAAYYLAPERSDGAPPSPASDLYALGVILYRMLTGRVPFDGPSPLSIAMRHRKDAPPPPSQLNPDCPSDLEEIVLRLLEKNPAARYASGGELLRELAVGTGGGALADGALADNGSANEADEAFAGDTPGGDVHANGDPAPASPPSGDSPLQTAQSRTGQAAPNPAVKSAPGVTTQGVPPLAAAAAIGASATAAAASTAAAPVAIPPPIALPPVAPPPVALPPVVRPLVVSPAGTPASSPSPARVGTLPAPRPPVTVIMPDDEDDAADDNNDDAAQDSADDDADDRAARKRQRRREAKGAFLAVFWLLVALGLLGGIVYGAYYFWQKETPHEVMVPKYLGKSHAEAIRILQARGLKMVVASEVYDPKRPAGTVIKGQPPAGKRVRVGREVMVTLSQGEEPIKMPDLTELDLQRARQIIERGGMRLGMVADQYHDVVPQGYICGQYPEPGQSFRRSEPINLIVSKGPQPSTDINDPTQLPPPQPRIPPGTDEGQEPLTTPSSGSPEVPMVSRTVAIQVAIPSGAPQEVRVVVRDAEGEHTVYRQIHAPGDLIDETVQVTRQQGTVAIVRVYVDGKLLKEQRI